jgi:DNA-binding winged helix-turn-helix (wHTH) protein/tetratricopeptide (TPR) repeat protein
LIYLDFSISLLMETLAGNGTGRAAFHFGAWEVLPSINTLSQGTHAHRIEPRVMDVLVALCAQAGEVLSAEQLLLQCWGSTLHGDNPVHKTIAQLRRLLGDSAVQPQFIETIRKRGYRTLAAVTRPAVPQALAGSWRDGSPFRGLFAFDADHAAIFFGRDALTAALVRSVSRQAAAGHALQLVLGPSGSGKSSIICAGLLPALARGSGGLDVRASAVIDLAERDGGHLLVGIASAMLDWQVDGADVFPGHSADALGKLLANHPAELLALLARAVAPPGRMVLVVDRLEALFAQDGSTAQECAQLVAALDTLAGSGQVIVVLACRNDFYPRIAALPVLLHGKHLGAHFDLHPPGHAEIAQIIRLPALAAGLVFETDPDTGERLDDILCRAAASSPDALPMLQYTLHELYRLRSDDNQLRCAAYHQLGGLEGAVSARAEALMAALGATHRTALARVLSLVVTVSADDDRVTSRLAPWSALRPGTERELVEALVEARLFVSSLMGSEAAFGVAHEALIRRWTRVVEWVAAHRDSLGARTRVANQTGRWIAHGRRSDLLLPRGKPMEEARAILDLATFSLTPQETELITLSAQRARRHERVRIGIASLIALLAVLAGLAGLSAFGAKQVAQQRRSEAEGLMGFMLGDFADKLRPIARLDLLDGVSAKALEYLAVSDGDDLNPASLAHRAKALQVIGEVRIARGDPQGAQNALQAAHAILVRQLEAAPDRPALRKQMGANVFWLGKIAMDRGDWERARAFFDRYRAEADRLAAQAPGDEEAIVEQSYAHNTLGSLALKRGDAAAAIVEFGLSIGLKYQVLARRPQDRMLAKDLADSLSWAGSANEVMGQFAAAQALYARQLALATDLHQAAPRDALWSDKLAEAHQHLGRLRAVQGQDGMALMHYRDAEALLVSNIETDRSRRAWQASLGFVQLAILDLDTGRDRSARLAQLAALSTNFAGLHRLDPHNQSWARQEAMVWQRTADVLLEDGQVAPAQRLLDAARQRLQELQLSNESDLLVRLLLATTWLSTADAAQRNSTPQLVHSACGQAATLLQALAMHTRDFRILDPWSRARICIGGKIAAQDAIARLAGIGYRAHTYQQYLSSHP